MPSAIRKNDICECSVCDVNGPLENVRPGRYGLSLTNVPSCSYSPSVCHFYSNPVTFLRVHVEVFQGGEVNLERYFSLAWTVFPGGLTSEGNFRKIYLLND